MKKIFLMFFLFFPLNAGACDCDIPNREKIINDAPLVFNGIAQKIDTNEEEGLHFTSFNVIEIIKGDDTIKDIIVRTHTHPIACGWIFELGLNYVVPVYGDGKEGYFYSDSCAIGSFEENYYQLEEKKRVE